MRLHRILVVLCALALGRSSPAAGQSLAELARQESARREAAGRGKVITNSDLKPVAPATVAAPADSTPTVKADANATSDAAKAAAAKAPADEQKDEKYWRQRVATARDGMARSQTFQQALEARVAALSTDFINRDDPAKRAQVGVERTKAVTELERVKKEIIQYQAELATIAEEARRAGVPPGWVR
jgi:hypothetical protein